MCEDDTPPVPPEDWECCESDCGDACVWQVYYRERRAYQERLKQRELSTQKDT